MSKTESLHYKLCCEGAKYLHSRKNAEYGFIPWKYIWVEPVVYGESCDIWGFNGGETINVEVKTSHSDFLADKKKIYRQNESLTKGMLRYYLAPKGIIKPEELPEGWGLLEWDGSIVRQRYNIVKTVKASKLFPPTKQDFYVLSSLMRREGIKEGIYNYRNK